MAGRKLVNADYNVSISWEDETESKDLLKKGSFNISFSEMNTTNSPLIEAGSSIDIDGVVYIFDSNEVITGTISSGLNYVRVSDAASTAIAEYTIIVPATYDYLKRGYYDSTGTKRYVLRFSSTGADFSDKRIMSHGEALYLENKISIDNDVDISGTLDVPIGNITTLNSTTLNSTTLNSTTLNSTTGSFSGAITATTLNTGQGANDLYDMNQNVLTSSSPTFNNITATGYFVADSKRITSANYLHGGMTENDFFDKLSPFIPNTGDTMLVSGQFDKGLAANRCIASRATRTSSTVISLYGMDFGNDFIVNTYTNGSASGARGSLAW